MKPMIPSFGQAGRQSLSTLLLAASLILPASAGQPPALPPNTSIELTYPLGYSPMVFRDGWTFGAKCVYKGKDLSSKVKWSGTADFKPAVGPRSSPIFRWPGMNTITLTVAVSPTETLSQTMMVHAVSTAGYACVGDMAYCPAESHGDPGDPKPVTGPITTGDSQVSIRGKGAARVGDVGTHASCSGTNTFKIVEGDPLVLIHGKRAARKGDRTEHCGGIGAIIGDKPKIPVYRSDMKQITLPNGDQIVFADLKWYVEATHQDGKVQRRSCRTQKHDIWQWFNSKGVCTRMTFELLTPNEATITYAFNFHDNGAIKAFHTTGQGIGNISGSLEWYPDGALYEVVAYHPWMKIKGMFVRNNNQFSLFDEFYENGDRKYKVIRDKLGNGKGERWLRDGRLWYTEKHEKNVIVDKTYHVKPEEVKSSDL